MASESDSKQQRERDRVLSLDFECLRSIPEGLSEVRVWWDKYLKVERVGKRIDLTTIDDALPEPETLQAISHDHVVPVLSAAKVGGFPAGMHVVEIVTPYYPLGSITDALLRGERFSARDAVRIARAGLSGLRELHEVHQIVHRDIKSGNILLCGEHPYAKIADLGLAGRMDASGHVHALNNPTLYSPPEFIETGRLSAASDIFAMGLVLRELLGGPFPYAEYQTSQIVERLWRLDNPILPEDRLLPVWTPKDLRAVVRKATAPRPGDRFQSAREMDDALARARVADWLQVSAERWEAPLVHQTGTIAVEAKWRARDKAYLISVKKRTRVRWMHVHGPVLAGDLRSTEARKAFDQATMIACAR